MRAFTRLPLMEISCCWTRDGKTLKDVCALLIEDLLFQKGTLIPNLGVLLLGPRCKTRGPWGGESHFEKDWWEG